jgi:hypothetical protein
MQEWINVVVWVLIGYAVWDIFKTIMINQYNKNKKKQEEQKNETTIK